MNEEQTPEYREQYGIEEPLAITRKLDICAGCEHFIPAEDKCNLCQCNVVDKARIRRSACIIHKWSPVWIGIGDPNVT